MIASTKKLEKYCTDYKNIENYTEAVKSPLRYDLHHRLEISDNKSRKDLKEENLYYGRPPEELIFLEHGEHTILHSKGKHPSEESRKKMSDAKKSEKCYMYGKPKSDETRRKISESRKGQLVSEETRRKISENNSRYWKGKHPSTETRKRISEARKGRHWHLEDGHRIWTD